MLPVDEVGHDRSKDEIWSFVAVYVNVHGESAGRRCVVADVVMYCCQNVRPGNVGEQKRDRAENASLDSGGLLRVIRMIIVDRLNEEVDRSDGGGNVVKA